MLLCLYHMQEQQDSVQEVVSALEHKETLLEAEINYTDDHNYLSTNLCDIKCLLPKQKNIVRGMKTGLMNCKCVFSLWRFIRWLKEMLSAEGTPIRVLRKWKKLRIQVRCKQMHDKLKKNQQQIIWLDPTDF